LYREEEKLRKQEEKETKHDLFLLKIEAAVRREERWAMIWYLKHYGKSRGY
jgi:hypothetical protein